MLQRTRKRERLLSLSLSRSLVRSFVYLLPRIIQNIPAGNKDMKIYYKIYNILRQKHKAEWESEWVSEGAGEWQCAREREKGDRLQMRIEHEMKWERSGREREREEEIIFKKKK